MKALLIALISLCILGIQSAGCGGNNTEPQTSCSFTNGVERFTGSEITCYRGYIGSNEHMTGIKLKKLNSSQAKIEIVSIYNTSTISSQGTLSYSNSKLSGNVYSTSSPDVYYSVEISINQDISLNTICKDRLRIVETHNGSGGITGTYTMYYHDFNCSFSY
jgi:hypothetical protein